MQTQTLDVIKIHPFFQNLGLKQKKFIITNMITRFFGSYLEGLRHELRIMTLQLKNLLKKRYFFKGVKCKIPFINVTCPLQCFLFLNILLKIDSTNIFFERVDIYFIDLKFKILITVTKPIWKGIKVALRAPISMLITCLK